jgi:hypothetical protein
MGQVKSAVGNSLSHDDRGGSPGVLGRRGGRYLLPGGKSETVSTGTSLSPPGFAGKSLTTAIPPIFERPDSDHKAERLDFIFTGVSVLSRLPPNHVSAVH